MIRYEISPTIREADILAALSVKEGPLRKRAIPMKIICFAFGAFYIYTGIQQRVMLIYAAAFLFMALIGIDASMKASCKMRIRRGADSEMYNARRTYEFDENGVYVSSKFGEHRYGWDRFKAWGHLRGYFWLLRDDSQIVLVRESDLSEPDSAALDKLLESQTK